MNEDTNDNQSEQTTTAKARRGRPPKKLMPKKSAKSTKVPGSRVAALTTGDESGGKGDGKKSHPAKKLPSQAQRSSTKGQGSSKEGQGSSSTGHGSSSKGHGSSSKGHGSSSKGHGSSTESSPTKDYGSSSTTQKPGPSKRAGVRSSER